MDDQEREELMAWARNRELEYYTSMTQRDLDLHIARKSCGNCYNWNKSRMCPKEYNVGGFSRGPNSTSAPCGEFTPDFDFNIALEVQVMKKMQNG